MIDKKWGLYVELKKGIFVEDVRVIFYLITEVESEDQRWEHSPWTVCDHGDFLKDKIQKRLDKNTVKSQIQTAVSIDYFGLQNLKCASNQGRLLFKFSKKYLKMGNNCIFSLLKWFSCGYNSRAVSISVLKVNYKPRLLFKGGFYLRAVSN